MLSVKIAINGFGRIGRALARLIISKKEYELVLINEPCDIDTSAYLLQYDSIHKKFDFDIKVENDYIKADDKYIKYSSCDDIKQVSFQECDILFECCGKYKDFDFMANSTTSNIKKIIITSMPKNNDIKVFVQGISDKKILQDSIISAGSCSTNALALILSLIEQKFDISSGSVTSIHSYTTDQNILDGRNDRDLRTSRAAAINIIPTPTGVAKNLSFVLPHLADKFMGFSVRVPVANVTMLDVTISLKKSATIDEINTIFANNSKGKLKGILEVDYDKKVSSDFISNSSTVSIAVDLTQRIDNRNLKIVAWFDNEYGYACRLYDLIKEIY